MPKYTLPTGKNRILAGAAGHAPVLGRNTDVFLALLPSGVRTAPVQQAFTVATGGMAAAATTITVDQTIATLIPAGQYLLFTNTTTGAEYLAKVSTNTNSGSSLAVVALAEAIPAGAVASFPAYLWDRAAADVDRAYRQSNFQTFNTGGDRDGVSVGADKGFTAPGIWYPKNAGYLTALHAAENGLDVWVQRIVGDSITEGPCGVTAAPSASPVDGNVSADLTFEFRGKATETLSAAG